MSQVRVAVLSDDAAFCAHFVRIAGTQPAFQVVGQDQRAVLRPPLRAARPHVLLVDGRLEGALSLCKLHKSEDGPAAIVVGVRDDDDWTRWALEAGARGILARDARAEDVVKAARVVAEGQVWAPRHVLAQFLERVANASGARVVGEAVLELRLSGRERDVFRLVAAGLSNKEVAERTSLSQATVKAHLTKIFRKLGLHRRSELSAAYHGLIPPPPTRASHPRRQA